MENRESDNLEQSGITWIHLSDWHQGRKTEFDRTVVLGELIKDIREREERIGSELKQIDFIVFSGDLAFSGQKEEYEAAKIDLLDPVLEATGLSWSRLFIVPGNHDLDRTAFKYLPSELEKPFQSEADMKDWLVDERGRKVLLEPFKTYGEFVGQYTKQQQPDYGNIRRWTINGKRIALLGLNSALMAGRNKNEKGEVDDYGKLVVGEPQFYSCLNQIEQDDLRIAVLHHPFQWLAPFDSDRIESLLKRKFDLILCGHQHKPEIQLVQGTQGKCIVIPGGATYASRKWANNYNFVHLDFDRDEGFKGLVYLRRWNGNRNEWTRDYETLGNGESSFPLYSPSTPAKKKLKRS